ncbi:hypothetical protein GCM10009819_04790 [Agromyces tropicus]|uniref:DUF2157 domain-containing protein n=1 Tax=Agromyces tropicus TaxID=555371 RepID=A0ABN2TYI6_9MICO
MTEPTPPAASELRRWPSHPDLLVDTGRCPACFTPLQGPVCGACGLRLDVPEAAELLAAGARVRDAETARQALITRLRAAQDATAAARLAPVVAAAAPAVTAPVASLGSESPPTMRPVAPAAGAEAPAAESASPPPPTPGRAASVVGERDAAPPPETRDAGTTPAPRRSGVQVLLLVLGVVLLSVAAIVFLVVAWVIASLEVRSVVIAAASVVVLGLAWLLRARGLPGTGEGVAAVAAVLLLLDAWIVRANDVFGAAAVDGASYWALALLAVAAALAAAGAAGRLRLPRIAAAALAPTGAFVGGVALAPDDEPGTAAWLGGILVLLLATASRALPDVERTIVRSFGAAGGGAAILAAAFAVPGAEPVPVWSFLAVALSWAVLLVATPAPSAWRVAAAAAVGLAVPLGPVLWVAADLEVGHAVWAAPAIAGAVAVAAALLTRVGWARRDARPAFLASAVVLAVAVVPALVVAAGTALDLQAFVVRSWGFAATFPSPRPFDDAVTLGATIGVLLGAVATTAVLWAFRRMPRLVAAAIAAWLVAGLSAAVLAPSPMATSAVLLVVAAGALATATAPVVRTVPASTPVLASGGILAALAAWGLAHTEASLWWWTMPAVLVLAVAGRGLAGAVWPTAGVVLARAAHVVGAALIVLAAAWTLPGWLAATGSSVGAPWGDPPFVTGLVGALGLAALAVLRRMPRPDRIAGGLVLVGGAMTADTVQAAAAAGGLAWVPPLVLATTGVAWVRSDLSAMRIALAMATPLALGFTAAGVVASLDGASVAVGLAIAALVAAAAAHLVLGPDRDARVAWSAAGALLTLLAVLMVAPPAAASATTWVALLLLAPVPVVLAALWGDPVGGPSPARHASWGTLVLGVGSAWAWSAERGADAPEWYTLPLAAGLLAAGVLIAWRRPAPGVGSSGRTVVLGAGAAVAVLPSVATAGASEPRTLVLVAVGAILVIAGAFLPADLRGVPARLLVVATGWTAATGAALVRGTAVAGDAPSGLPVEFWPILALAVGVTAAVLWSRQEAPPAQAAEAGLAVSVAVATLPSWLAMAEGSESVARALVLFPALAVLHVLATATRMRPLGGPWLAWTSLATAAALGAVVLVADAVRPFDLVTVPIGAALVGAGAIRLRRSPSAGSWPTLGPGLAVLLLPALLADWTDPVLWRLVALGVVAAAAVVVGAVRRLQAPLLLGGSVLLVHAVAQLWPWISLLYRAVWWWLWLGLAGALLIVLAATYERQVRFARGAVRTIAALR